MTHPMGFVPRFRRPALETPYSDGPHTSAWSRTPDGLGQGAQPERCGQSGVFETI